VRGSMAWSMQAARASSRVSPPEPRVPRYPFPALVRTVVHGCAWALYDTHVPYTSSLRVGTHDPRRPPALRGHPHTHVRPGRAPASPHDPRRPPIFRHGPRSRRVPVGRVSSGHLADRTAGALGSRGRAAHGEVVDVPGKVVPAPATRGRDRSSAVPAPSHRSPPAGATARPSSRVTAHRRLLRRRVSLPNVPRRSPFRVPASRDRGTSSAVIPRPGSRS
jgi:hypothetical protein